MKSILEFERAYVKDAKGRKVALSIKQGKYHLVRKNIEEVRLANFCKEQY